MYKPDEMGRLTQPILTLLLQLGIFRFGFFQDGDVGVAVFPEREEIFLGGESARAGEVAISRRRHCGALLRRTAKGGRPPWA
ncbi:MAG: hypothetical protein WBZ11_01800, partial [Candidatus Sulfotelmatobacter sp.]